jgi:hypothetical protein
MHSGCLQPGACDAMGRRERSVFHHGERALHFGIRGSGEPVLLIHGLGSSGADQPLPDSARCRRDTDEQAFSSCIAAAAP